MKTLDAILGYFHIILWIFFFPVRKLNRQIGLKKRICIIKLSAMGDVICLYPAIHGLYKTGYEVTLITTERSNPTLFEAANGISRIVVLQTNVKRFLLSFINVAHNICLSEVCINADQYYNLSKVLCYASSHSIGFKTKRKLALYRKKVEYSYLDNEKIQFFRLAEMADKNVNKSSLDKVLVFPESRLENLELLAGSVLLYPGSGPSAKIRRWPLGNWIELYKIFKKEGHDCKFIGGPDELVFVEALLKSGACEEDVFINKLPLIDLIALMRHGSAFIGNDAGLFHVADTLQLPLVGLFGPNLSSKWGSLRANTKHLEFELNCRPCIVAADGIIPQNCKIESHACMENILVSMVFGAWSQVVAET